MIKIIFLIGLGFILGATTLMVVACVFSEHDPYDKEDTDDWPYD